MKKISIIIGAILALILVVAGSFIYSEISRLNSAWGSSPDDDFIITIEEGKTARDIANQLVDKQVIQSNTMFLVMADLRGFANKLKAGEYMIKGVSTPLQILDMFATGFNYRHDLVIPEGFTQADIAKRCEEMEICAASAFLAECHLRNNVFPFVIAQAPGGANASIEGLLFPDTYQFIKKTPPERVVNRMISRYNEVWDLLMQEANAQTDKTWWWQDDSLATQKQVHNVLVLASVIEKEVHREDDRPLVASVFVNRLKRNMPLQSDATVRYFSENWSGPILKSELEADSPYNTYKNTGLPAGAICNPGRSSLRAALMPAESDYLYFITMSDGVTRFAATHDEHVKSRQELRRNQREAQSQVDEPETQPSVSENLNQ